MDIKANEKRTNEPQQCGLSNQPFVGPPVDEESIQIANRPRPPWILGTSMTRLPEATAGLAMPAISGPRQEDQPTRSPANFLEYVERRFIPEFVAVKRSAGRSHFRAILKHVLRPEHVNRAFGMGSETAQVKLKAVPGWPYLDALQLSDIDPKTVRDLSSAALRHGYSTQTATHIRNVIRSIFTHAIRNGCYSGNNPAAQVKLPAITRKEPHVLTLAQLEYVLNRLRYPEKGLAIFATLTELSVAEICGLQWKYLNASSLSRSVGNDVIPPRTIAVRKQFYRGEFEDVSGGRRRFVSISELLGAIVRDLMNRERFTSPEDFVLVSRDGTPIHPENLAARRLKPIGMSFDMPWLSWHVFHRTRASLRSEYGRRLYEEFERLLPFQRLESGRAPNGKTGTRAPFEIQKASIGGTWNGSRIEQFPVPDAEPAAAD